MNAPTTTIVRSQYSSAMALRFHAGSSGSGLSIRSTMQNERV